MGPQVGHIRLLHVMLAASRMPVVVVAVGKETEKNMSLLLLRKTEKNRGVCLASSSMPVVVVAVVVLVGAQQMAKISPKSA